MIGSGQRWRPIQILRTSLFSFAYKMKETWGFTACASSGLSAGSKCKRMRDIPTLLRQLGHNQCHISMLRKRWIRQATGSMQMSVCSRKSSELCWDGGSVWLRCKQSLWQPSKKARLTATATKTTGPWRHQKHFRMLYKDLSLHSLLFIFQQHERNQRRINDRF